MHPPVVRVGVGPDEGRYVLVAGERRTRALDTIAHDDLFFLCDGKTILPGEFPVTLITDQSDEDYIAAELEENIIREDLSWQDRVRAITTIHAMRQRNNPEQTQTDTAREIVEKGGIADSAKGFSEVKTRIREAVAISRHMNDPQVAKARNATEAYAHVVRKEEAAYAAELIRRKLTSAVVADVQVRQGDALSILPRLDSEQFDLIISDPPYGIGASSDGYRSRTKHHHNYDDSPDAARSLLQTILLESFRLTKPRANLFFFCDIDLFPWLQSTSANAGWIPFRTPIIWAKSDGEGLAPWGRQGFRRTYELIFFATKAQKGLLHSPTDILRVNRVGRDARDYGPEKPVELMSTLIECSTLPGEYILDPCCGSGSSLLAAKRLRRRALGIEIDEAAANLALVKVSDEKPLDIGAPSAESL